METINKEAKKRALKGIIPEFHRGLSAEDITEAYPELIPALADLGF